MSLKLYNIYLYLENSLRQKEDSLISFFNQTNVTIF